PCLHYRLQTRYQCITKNTMARLFLSLAVIACALMFVQGAKDVTSLQVGVKFKPAECTRKAANGDNVHVHYVGKLTDGTEFDNSYKRGEPIAFVLGAGRVIKGWDQGVLGMCLAELLTYCANCAFAVLLMLCSIGEKRKLRIPSHLGYGDSGAPPTIPGGATLVFDTELVKID
ncbi:hypothetical protein QJQ45_013862, partial [Haematococcus lacustris]